MTTVDGKPARLLYYIILFTGTFIICTSIIVAGYTIRKNKEEVLGETNIVKIDKQTLVYPKNSEFKYYWELKPSTDTGRLRSWDGTSAHYHINKDGLNDRYDYVATKSADVFRIITLGDSFTFGEYVDTSKNWTELLEDHLNANKPCKKYHVFQVVNLGMGGFGVPYIVKFFIDKGLKYNPDLIVWLESGTGLARDNERMQPIIDECRKTATSEGRPVKPADFYPCWKKAQKLIIEKNTEEPIYRDIRQSMSRFILSKHNIPTIYALFKSITTEATDEFKKRVPNGSQMTVLNIVPTLTSSERFPDGHPNEEGHATIARSIYEYLSDKSADLLMCKSP